MNLREYAEQQRQREAQNNHKNDLKAGGGTDTSPPGIGAYKAFYRAAFNYHSKYTDNPPKIQADWDAAIEELGNIIKQFGETEFVKSVMFAILDEIEAQAQKGVKE